MAKVYFVREEISIEVPVGISVLEAEIQAGLAPDVPCGGQGTCGKCLVKVDGKPVLACQTKVEKDCQVEIPGKTKGVQVTTTSVGTQCLQADPHRKLLTKLHQGLIRLLCLHHRIQRKYQRNS